MSDKSEMCVPFNRDDTIIEKTQEAYTCFSLILSHKFILRLVLHWCFRVRAFSTKKVRKANLTINRMCIWLKLFGVQLILCGIRMVEKEVALHNMDMYVMIKTGEKDTHVYDCDCCCFFEKSTQMQTKIMTEQVLTGSWTRGWFS